MRYMFISKFYKNISTCYSKPMKTFILFIVKKLLHSNRSKITSGLKLTMIILMMNKTKCQHAAQIFRMFLLILVSSHSFCDSFLELCLQFFISHVYCRKCFYSWSWLSWQQSCMVVRNSRVAHLRHRIAVIGHGMRPLTRALHNISPNVCRTHGHNIPDMYL